ncbi:MAG: glycosyltransferase family 2 protein [Clostridia bacterium]|nr:glycosyltransferase family 2 protein [Clostridia bacterium]
MKLIIQIPCYNEEENLAKVIDELPKKIEGIDIIEYMVINDGSTDKTKKIAERKGIHHIINVFPNKGLANTFTTGIDHALKNGADIIVNIDGDHQYSGKDVKKLVKPIIEGKADIVIGERQIEKFSPLKRFLQRLGSLIIRFVSKTKVNDAPSGFRAYSREEALKLNVYNQFTYTLETIIQAGSNKVKIENVKIESFPNTRESRLFKNEFQYIYKSSANVIKSLFIYKPIRIWGIASIIFFVITITFFLICGVNSIIPYAFLTFTIIFAVSSMQSISIQANRKQLERIQYYLKKENYNNNGK